MEYEVDSTLQFIRYTCYLTQSVSHVARPERIQHTYIFRQLTFCVAEHWNGLGT